MAAPKSLAHHTFAAIYGRMGDLPDLVSLSASASVAEALTQMAAKGVGTLAVTSADSPNKIIGE